MVDSSRRVLLESEGSSKFQHTPSELSNPLCRAAIEVGHREQTLLNRRCSGNGSSVRYDKRTNTERSSHCVPDMRYFASALGQVLHRSKEMTGEVSRSGSEQWSGVRPLKLTSTSWSEDRTRGFLSTLPRTCRLSTSSGPHPVEYTGGHCFNEDALGRLRRPSGSRGSVQLFARKFGPGMVQNLLELGYLSD